MTIYRVRRSRCLERETPADYTQAGLAERVAAAAFDRRPFESLDAASLRYLTELSDARAAQLEREKNPTAKKRRRRRR